MGWFGQVNQLVVIPEKGPLGSFSFVCRISQRKIGRTDSHTSLSTASSDNFWGKFSREFPSAQLRRWDYSAGGYAGIWATENTRQALFAAMQRKEVYATTGPRIKLRFFAGWDYASNDAERPDLVYT